MKLIYTKSGFYSKETNIHGFFTILSKSIENINVFIAWIPEYLIEPNDIDRFIQLDGILASNHEYSDIQINLGEEETMMVMLKSISSLYICPPSLQDQGSIVITLKSGDILKPLFYSSKDHWPGCDIVDILSNFSPLESNQISASAYQRGQQAYSPLPTTEDPWISTIKDIQWSMLEKLSRITQATASHRIARPVLPLLAPPLQRLLRGNNLNEYQTASHYLDQFGQDGAEHFLADVDLERLLADAPELQGPAPIHTRTYESISAKEWMTFFDQEGRLCVPVSEVKRMIFQRGLEPDVRIEAWKFLLGIFSWQSSMDEREAIRQSRVDAYYRLKAVWFDDIEIRKTKEFQDEKHRIDKDVHRTDRTQEAFAGEDMPNPDPDMVVGTNPNLETMKDILVTYNFYNTELGYVQGMSDLLAPLFVVMGDEAMSFWAFTCFMDTVQYNFYMDQSGMHAQLKTLNHLIQFMDPVLYKRLEEIEISNLFFCFRWLLVWFKREFEWEGVIELWEILWTNYLTDKMILFITLAVIDTHRNKLLNELNQFDEVLRYINDLTGHIDLRRTLERAEVLFYQFERKVRAMQHKSNQLRERLEYFTYSIRLRKRIGTTVSL
ncbi:hypothetical protein RO3G_17026 [Rhizopus delemar RA 99-880]|uniref:Rab-GAP TBC domain-containing protein n=1 Tax=Rhizopus delemar (strain RA 99-880 / ATCC MYA-4621 / FGSC 9543 / NRRL 43880) TaxID=246409 RepID=I1CUT9_RHIO9|nr:hypothetical protein RO3G_17026 [Rhizopus delemar RA 99-880]|eukprot:EIE92219.1 hypothetical protein RO3G_17026 [Rhizopus delemar RA 99-880]